jgi:hypothetical protein
MSANPALIEFTPAPPQHIDDFINRWSNSGGSERANYQLFLTKLGAHFTPRAYVERLVMPTLIDPLPDQW